MLTSAVFGMAPTVRESSYVDRGNLDQTMSTFLSRTIHLAIKGPSKCGKSWLRQKALRNAITVQCRHLQPFTNLYVDALSQLEIRTELKTSIGGEFSATLTASGSMGANLVARAAAKLGLSGTVTTGKDSILVGHDVNDLRFVAEIIKQSGRRLVVEDFHYMSLKDRTGFAFDLKTLWDYGLFVVIVGIWTQTNLLLQLNQDLAGRVHEISIDWSKEELGKIVVKGGRELNIVFLPELQTRLESLAYSNAGIFQQLVLFTLEDAGITESRFFKQQVSDVRSVENAAMVYADQLNPVYQQFAKRVSAGIRSRKNATGIYAHAMAVILDASDDELMTGLRAREIAQRAVVRQSRIQYGNLKAILDKIEHLQIDEDGRGLVIAYNEATEEVTVVDRQLLLYRRYATVHWPWDAIISEADAARGQVEADI